MYAQLLVFWLFACQIVINQSTATSAEDNPVNAETDQQTPHVALPEGYQSFPEDHAAYKIYKEGTTWYEARYRCIAEGARLAITDSVDKIRHINTMKDEDWDSKWLHVGIHRLSADTEWVRADNGLPVTSVPWKSDEPSGDGGCAGISLSEDGLISYECDKEEREYFVCEILTSIESTVTSAEDNPVKAETDKQTSRITLPKGYHSFPEDHAAYKIYKEQATWDEARDRCIAEGARLAITDSVDKIRHINTLKGKDWDSKWLHVGIHRLSNDTEWVRADNGLPATSVPWKSDEPSGDGGCAGISLSEEGLISYECDKEEREYFVCEILTSIESTVTSAEDNPVKAETDKQTSRITLPKGYHSFPEDHAAYKIYKEQATWDEARDRCISEGARLAIPDSVAKVEHINTLKDTDWDDKWLHVGIHRLSNDTEWVRADNGLPATSVPWKSNEPSGDGGCVGISLFEVGLISYECNRVEREYFVCEISTSVEPTVTSGEGNPVNAETDKQTPRVALPEGYQSFPEDHAAYKIYKEETTWDEARERCIAEGARLAITDSVDKIRHINTLKDEDWGSKWLHVGIHRLSNDTGWVRADNGLSATSVPWKSDEPSGDGGCAGISLSEDGLISYECDREEREYYVCEILT